MSYQKCHDQMQEKQSVPCWQTSSCAWSLCCDQRGQCIGLLQGLRTASSLSLRRNTHALCSSAPHTQQLNSKCADKITPCCRVITGVMRAGKLGDTCSPAYLRPSSCTHATSHHTIKTQTSTKALPRGPSRAAGRAPGVVAAAQLAAPGVEDPVHARHLPLALLPGHVAHHKLPRPGVSANRTCCSKLLGGTNAENALGCNRDGGV